MSIGTSDSPFLNREGGWGVRLLLLLACLSVRLVALGSDPPSWLSWSTGLYTDEGFYTLDARHEALFGTLAPGDFHDRLLSPLLSVMQQGVFQVFGVGIVQARSLSVLFSLLTVFVFWLGLRRAYNATVADYGAVFLSLAPVFALYNRTALQETPTVFWLVLAFTLWAYGASESGNRAIALLLLAGLSAAVALVFKSLAALAVPALVLGMRRIPSPGGFRQPLPTAWRGVRVEALGFSEALSTCGEGGGLPPGGDSDGGEGRAGWGFSAAGLLIGLALYVCLWVAPYHAELSRMTTYYRVHQIQPHSWYSVWLNIRRAVIGGQRGVFPYLLATLPVLCGLAGWGVWRRNGHAADRFLSVWLAGGLLFCLLSSYAPSRYYVLFLPALAGLAARGISEMGRNARIVAAALFLLTSAGWYGLAGAQRSDSQRNAGSTLARILPPGSVLIGDFAPILCVNTPFAATTVQPGLANEDRPVERLKATHVVVVRNARRWQDWWHSRYPSIVQPSHRVATFDFGGARHYIVDVYAVKEAR